MVKLMDLAAAQQGSTTGHINRKQERAKKLTERRLPRFEVSGSFAGYSEDSLFYEAPDKKAAKNAPEAEDRTLSLEEQIDSVLTLMSSQSCLQEILYKLLSYCADEEREYELVEDYLSKQPEITCSHILQSPYTLIKMMVRAGGLVERSYDAECFEVATESARGRDKSGEPPEVEYVTVTTTEAGRAAQRIASPQRRLEALVEQRPHRRETFLGLIEFCAEKPRTFPEIKNWYQSTPGLAIDLVQKQHNLAADFYVDKLEKSGALVWTGAWCATDEGRALLAREHNRSLSNNS